MENKKQKTGFVRSHTPATKVSSDFLQHIIRNLEAFAIEAHQTNQKQQEQIRSIINGIKEHQTEVGNNGTCEEVVVVDG